MWIASGLLVLALIILRYTFHALQGLTFMGSVAVALMLVLSALGVETGHSMWWWAYAARHTAAHLTASY